MTGSRSGAPRGSSWEGMTAKDSFVRGRPSPAQAKVLYYDETGKAIDPTINPDLHEAARELESNHVLSVTEDRKREAAEEDSP